MTKDKANSLAMTHPEIAAQWHPTKNWDLKPTDITYGSEKKVWWHLPYDVPMDYSVEHLRGKHFDFEWEVSPNNRTSGGNKGCPYISNPQTAVWIGFNDLATTHPNLVKEWHPIKNGKLTPMDIMAGSRKKVWWYLPYDDPKTGEHFDFEWESSVNVRALRGHGCPYLLNKQVWIGYNDFATTHSELAAEWHPTKNGKLTPEMVTAGSHKKIWWCLSYEVPMDYPVEHLRGQHFNFEWEASISNRVHKGSGCPFLSETNPKAWKGFNDLETVNPELAKEWHPIRNGNLKPTDITDGSGQKIWWLLPYDVPMNYPVEHLRGQHFNFEWEATIASRNNAGSGCPFLSQNPAVWQGFNDLATVNPELAKQWHPIKNNNLTDAFGRDLSTPNKISWGSSQKVWWLLPYDVPMDYPIKHLRGQHFNFEWEATPANRSNGLGCPFITNQAIWVGFNDLATTHPILASQWHPTKNGELKPTDVMAGSGKKVWWLYIYDNQVTGKQQKFEWESTVDNRNKDGSCPFIFSSKGEEAIREILRANKVDFEEQYKFKDRFYLNKNNPLRDDFVIFDKNKQVVGAIEYHGEQHYEPVNFSGRGQQWAKERLEITQKRDRVKSEYLKKHGIRQLIIPYWEFNNIEKIVENFINELSNTYEIFNIKINVREEVKE